jgi:hypothetical protein
MDEIQRIKNDQLEGAKVSSLAVQNPDMEAEYVPLPSRGVFYKGAFKNLERIKVRKLNWEDEDILTTKSYYDNGTVFNEIIKNTVVDENGFNPKDLLPIDRDTILWWLRIGAFGSDYTVPIPCPSCGKKNDVTWDLGSFEMPDYKPAILDELLTNGYKTTVLPASGATVKLVVPSIGREQEIAKRLNLKKEKTKTTRDFNVTGKLLASIIEAIDVDGTVYRGTDQIAIWLKKANKGNQLSMVDSRFIQATVRDITLDVDTRKDVVCSHCDHLEEGVRMPMSIYFFWPEYAEVSRVSDQID